MIFFAESLWGGIFPKFNLGGGATSARGRISGQKHRVSQTHLVQDIIPPNSCVSFLLFLPFFGEGEMGESISDFRVSGWPPHRKGDFFFTLEVSLSGEEGVEASKGHTISHKKISTRFGEKARIKTIRILTCYPVTLQWTEARTFFLNIFCICQTEDILWGFFKVAGTLMVFLRRRSGGEPHSWWIYCTVY